MLPSINHQNKVFFTSLGCPRNLVDSEVMLGLLLQSGFQAAQTLNEADCIVINTCGFLEAARDESSETIRVMVADKKHDAKVVVTGCMVQQERDILRDKFPEVHYFLGSGETEKIVEAVTSLTPGETITKARSYLEWGEIPRVLSTPKHYGYLKIAEGCLKNCSFCIIPKIKGPLRSKSQQQVLKEFKALLNRGVFEVILIAQDLGDYGKERKEQDGLADLIKLLLSVEQPFWLRLLYVYPDEISPALIELMASDPRICPYLDMPIQHINDDVLKSMKRKTSGGQIKDTIGALREHIPNIIIRTSLMVGFPGETNEQFEELNQFVRDYSLDNIGIFQYSKEADSTSAQLPNHLPCDVKQARFDVLSETQLSCVRAKNTQYVGQELSVIVEDFHPESSQLYVGRFYGQCPEIDGQVIINAGELKQFGQLHTVQITDALDYDLVGTIID